MKISKLNTAKVILRNSSVSPEWRTVYSAYRVAKTEQCVKDIWQPEFLKQLPERHVWAVAIRQGPKFFTEQEFRQQFEEV